MCSPDFCSTGCYFFPCEVNGAPILPLGCAAQWLSLLDILQRRCDNSFAIKSVHGSTERHVISITWARKEVAYKTAHAYCQYSCSRYSFNLLPPIGEASIETTCEAEDSKNIMALSQIKAEPDHGVGLSLGSERAPLNARSKKRKLGINHSYTAAEAAKQLRSLLLADTGTSLTSLLGEAQRLRILACGLGLLDQVPERVFTEVGDKQATRVFSAVLINLAFGLEGIQDEDHARAEEDLRNQLNIKLSNKAVREHFLIYKCVVSNCMFGHSDWYVSK